MIPSVVIALVLPAALGFLALGLLLRRDGGTDLVTRLGFSFPLGMGLVTLQMFLLGLLRVPFVLLPLAAIVLAEIAVLALLAWRTGIRFSEQPGGDVAPPAPGRTSTAVSVFSAILAAWVVVKAVSVFVETGLRPIFAWDSWANWSAGAKAFYYAHSLLLDAPPPDYFGGGMRIVEYPLHNHLTQVWMAVWAGGFDEVLVKMSAPAYFLSLGAAAYGVFRKEIGPLPALWLVVVLLSSPLLSYHAIEVYSDLPLGIFLFLALASLLQAMRGRRAFWPLTGAFCAVALFTKDEALFFVLPLLASALFSLRGPAASQGGSRRTAAAGLLAPLLLVAPWFLFKFSHGLRMGAGGIKVVFAFYPEVVPEMIRLLFSLSNFALTPVFAIVLLVLAGKPTREFLHTAVPVVCLAGFFTAVYAFTTYYYEQFSIGTVFFRNVLTCYPSLCLLMALLLRRAVPDDWRRALSVPPAAVTLPGTVLPWKARNSGGPQFLPWFRPTPGAPDIPPSSVRRGSPEVDASSGYDNRYRNASAG